MDSSIFTKSTNTEKQSPVFTVPSLFTILSSNGTRLSNISRQLRKTYENNPNILNIVNKLYSSLNTENNPEVIINLIDVYKAYLGNTNIDTITSEDKPFNHAEFKSLMVYPLVAMIVQVWNHYCYEYKTNEETYTTFDVNNAFFRNFIVNDLSNFIATLFNINEEYGSTLMNKLELVNYIDGLIMVEDTTIELYPINAEHLMSLLNVSVDKNVIRMSDSENGRAPKVSITNMNSVSSLRYAALCREPKAALFTFDELETISLAVQSDNFALLVKLCTDRSEYYIRNMLLLIWHLITLKRDAEE